MFDSDTLRPVIIAMALYLALSIMIPKIITKPTGVKIIDDEVMYLLAQKGFLMSGVILIGIIMYGTNYISTQMLE
jgi:uncharacterized membrane protein